MYSGRCCEATSASMPSRFGSLHQLNRERSRSRRFVSAQSRKSCGGHSYVMRVLLVSPYDYGRGGGPIAMYRLHQGLRKAGVDSKLLCKYKKLESSESVAIPHSFLSSRLESRLGQLTSRFGLNDIHCLSTFKIQRLRAYQEADLLDFHCIHSGYFNYLALPSLTAHKLAVLTLHDMWPLTGHCMVS